MLFQIAQHSQNRCRKVIEHIHNLQLETKLIFLFCRQKIYNNNIIAVYKMWITNMSLNYHNLEVEFLFLTEPYWFAFVSRVTFCIHVELGLSCENVLILLSSYMCVVVGWVSWQDIQYNGPLKTTNMVIGFVFMSIMGFSKIGFTYKAERGSMHVYPTRTSLEFQYRSVTCRVTHTIIM